MKVRYTRHMPKQHDEELHNSVHAFRTEHKVTQQELADAVDVTRQTILAIEKGNYVPSVLLALKIANFFEASIEELFSYTD